jgi:acyl-CoA reductase-like NAD-dependent aldehyde dehydrogenase
MSHDPLCINVPLQFVEDCAMCRVIAKVREDEIEQAVTRLRKAWKKWHAFLPAERELVVNAVKGEAW